MIKDSGNRTKFETGAVRDLQDGSKGRCDLMPLDVVAMLIEGQFAEIFNSLALFQRSGDAFYLQAALGLFTGLHFDDPYTMLLEVSKHYSNGCAKYGENNWMKGIPLKSYVDSSARHLLKWLRGDDDEPHDLAFCWNVMSAIWTCKHKPELNSYAKDGEADD